MKHKYYRLLEPGEAIEVGDATISCENVIYLRPVDPASVAQPEPYLDVLRDRIALEILSSMVVADELNCLAAYVIADRMLKAREKSKENRA